MDHDPAKNSTIKCPYDLWNEETVYAGRWMTAKRVQFKLKNKESGGVRHFQNFIYNIVLLVFRSGKVPTDPATLRKMPMASILLPFLKKMAKNISF
jgi:hypothetical protein